LNGCTHIAAQRVLSNGIVECPEMTMCSGQSIGFSRLVLSWEVFLSTLYAKGGTETRNSFSRVWKNEGSGDEILELKSKEEKKPPENV
jgi:hypothetical protein